MWDMHEIYRAKHNEFEMLAEYETDTYNLCND